MKHLHLVMAGALLLLLVIPGCTAVDDAATGSGDGDAPPAGESPDLEMVAPPGIYDLPGGDTQALGILTYRDLEGGFWAVAKTADPTQAASAELVAVIVPTDGLEVDLQTMNGEYVSVVGVRNDGPSIYMSGPVIQAKTVEIVSDTATE